MKGERLVKPLEESEKRIGSTVYVPLYMLALLKPFLTKDLPIHAKFNKMSPLISGCPCILAAVNRTIVATVFDHENTVHLLETYLSLKKVMRGFKNCDTKTPSLNV